jgi:integrase
MVRLGLRRGEALGLTWADVDLDTGRIMIRLQLQKIPDPKGSGAMVLMRVRPKTDASVRMVRASGSLLERLRAERASEGTPSDTTVVQMRGKPVDPDVLTRWLARETAPLGIRCSPHRLRHTAATLMLNEVGSIATVSSFLGHSDLKMTSVYARVLAETTDAAAEALGAVVDGLK